MGWRKAFPSKWLRGEDLGDRKPFVVIDHVTYADIGGEQKLAMWFVDNAEKPLPLNTGHCVMLEEMFKTDDETQWTGVRIQLFTVEVEFKGQRKLGVRFLPAPLTNKPGSPSKPAPPKAAVVAVDTDEDEPF
jgi:hypothetical protein